MPVAVVVMSSMTVAAVVVAMIAFAVVIVVAGSMPVPVAVVAMIASAVVILVAGSMPVPVAVAAMIASAVIILVAVKTIVAAPLQKKILYLFYDVCLVENFYHCRAKRFYFAFWGSGRSCQK